MAHEDPRSSCSTLGAGRVRSAFGSGSEAAHCSTALGCRQMLRAESICNLAQIIAAIQADVTTAAAGKGGASRR